MAHERKEIRDAAAAHLVAAATSAGARVFKTRLNPMQGAELPAINLHTEQETVSEESKNTAPRELKRTVVLQIDGWVAGDLDTLDDDLDALALEIETAMDRNVNLEDVAGEHPKAHDSMLVSTEIDTAIVGNRPMGVVRLEYAVTYFSQLRTEAAVDDFDTADIKFPALHEGVAIHADNQANDHVTEIHE